MLWVKPEQFAEAFVKHNVKPIQHYFYYDESGSRRIDPRVPMTKSDICFCCAAGVMALEWFPKMEDYNNVGFTELAGRAQCTLSQLTCFTRGFDGNSPMVGVVDGPAYYDHGVRVRLHLKARGLM